MTARNRRLLTRVVTPYVHRKARHRQSPGSSGLRPECCGTVLAHTPPEEAPKGARWCGVSG
jgi:hypothetical protein